MNLDGLFEEIKAECLPAVWSRGVALSRDHAVIEDARRENEIRLRVVIPNRPVSPTITLWPPPEGEADGEGDWFCDCGDRNDPCVHVAAAVVALKNGQLRVAEAPTAGGASESSAPPVAALPRVSYRLFRAGKRLRLERWVGERRLVGTLVGWLGGVQSGRIPGPLVAATRDDFAVDQALGVDPREELPSLQRLLEALHDLPGVTLDGAKIEVSSRALSLRARLEDSGAGFTICALRDETPSEVFENGAALCEGKLRPVRDPALTPEQRAWFGARFPAEDAARLVTEILPALEKAIPVEVASTRLPRVVTVEPRVVLRMEREGDALGVAAELVYGDPPVAEVREGKLVSLVSGLAPRRDLSGELTLAQRLRHELHLAPGVSVRLEGREAVEFARKASGWTVAGTGARAFEVRGKLEARMEFSGDAFSVAFGGASVDGSGGGADPARVFAAWHRGDDAVPLLGGGWAELPRDWLERYGASVEKLLAARDARGQVPALRQPELARLAEDAGFAPPASLATLRRRLEGLEEPPAFHPPADLRAELRTYQLSGARWLVFLRELGLGALLADDMGLGKTLQALCALKGRSLVVAPTSVVHAWAEQARAFRPGLRVAIYHGGARELDPAADLTLTTYGVLRLDQATLAAVEWDTLILDEAQTIKNPDSQAAVAARSLRARFRLALTGTPVENRLTDLWSQLEFLNPGLLGTREEFDERFAQPMSRGSAEAAAELRKLVRPFFLRRLKRDVAPELPPRTETTLRCELSASERAGYETVLASARTEVLAKLAEGGSVLAALEALLRLRQACCHPALVPGGVAETSSKLELLCELLEESIAEGHRSLVFSQWTSFLDLIEARLERAGIPRLRLDGSTRDREDVVRSFQSESGPPVLLISLKAGGVGLTLTAADHVFLLDPWWNPATEDQAADRAHRIGQEKPVLVHRLVADNSVEERVLELQERKRALAAAALDGSGAAAASLSREELLALLA